MIVNSFDFLWMFPLIFLVYVGVMSVRRKGFSRLGNYLLLGASYALFWYYNELLTLVLLGVTLATWLGGLALSRFPRRRVITVTIILLAALPLLVFKYHKFVLTNVEGALSQLGIEATMPGLSLVVPLGISFFTLQAIGYFVDVAKGRIKAERNLADYMLFVAFFPQIASGPISKAADLLPQIKAERKVDPELAVSGLKWLLWGMFMKVVVADNIGEYIQGPLLESSKYTSPTVVQAVLLYPMQIYCDFAGYSFMAVGLGELLGFRLINNFERPYFAASVTEFWHRWHRSLSIWLKDYIYIPLGGSRCSRRRNYLNILATFLVSGLWHGANWTFILWGGMHGGVQILEKHFGLQKRPARTAVRVLRIITTFLIVSAAWVFFVHPTVSGALTTFHDLFASPGKKWIDFSWLYLGVAVVFLKDLADEYSIRRLRLLHHRHAAVRWTAYSALMAAIMIFAVYGEKFIYSGF